MNKARRKFEQLIEVYVTVDNEIYAYEIPAIAFDILNAISKGEVPGVGVCEGCRRVRNLEAELDEAMNELDDIPRI